MKRFLGALLALVLLSTPVEAATRRAFPGGMFFSCLPGGLYGGLQDGKLATHAGDVALPDAALFTRITDVGGFKAAVKSHSTDRVLVYAGGQWTDDGRISHGTQGHIWTDAGSLFVLQPCANCDSQGIRYWDGGPVFGSPTYNPFSDFARANNVTLIYEWTLRDGIAIGQGEEGGTVIENTRTGKHYLLEPGDARFINFEKRGDNLCVAVTKFREREAVIHELTVAEIDALPAYVPPTPNPVPPTPKPTPPPPPPDSTPQRLSQKATVERIRLKYPTPLGEHHWEFLVEVAQATGAKLFRKDGGTNIFVPPLNLSVSQDIIILAPEWIDILVDGEGAARPDWAAHPNAGEPEKWVDVSGIDLSAGHRPPPPPEPKPDPKVAELEARIAALDARLSAAVAEAAALRTVNESANRQIAAIEAERDDLKAQLAAERAKPEPRCEVRGVPSWAGRLGIRASCVVLR